MAGNLDTDMQAKLWSKIWLSAVLLAITASALASTAPKKPPSTQHAIELLMASRYTELHGLMQGVQDGYKAGVYTDEQLLAAFRSFYVIAPAQVAHYDEWIKQQPTSYVARLARGIHYKMVAGEARGGKYISETSKEQLEAMRGAFKLASADLQASMKLDSKPLLSIHHSMDMNRNLGRSKASRKLVDAANKLDPSNFIVRRKYLLTLEPRWGGSIEEMRAFIDECRLAGLPEAKLEILRRDTLEEEAWVYINYKEDFAAAEQIYQLLVATDADDLDALRELVWVQTKLKKHDAVIANATRLLKRAPKDSRTYMNRGSVYSQKQMHAESISDYTKAAELGSVDAQRYLGRVYWHGKVVPKDETVALKWMRAAAEQGDEEAKHDLYWAQQQISSQRL